MTLCAAMVFLVASTVTRGLICAVVSSSPFARCWALRLKEHPHIYHPQGIGQVERFNRTVEAMLSKVVNKSQYNWDSQLFKALLDYKTAVHEATKFTPFHLTFACLPQLPTDVILERLQCSSFLLTICTPST